jgi:hypothetical protein
MGVPNRVRLLCHVTVERFKIAVARKIANVGRIKHDHVKGARAGDELGLFLFIDAFEWHFDHFGSDSGFGKIILPKLER